MEQLEESNRNHIWQESGNEVKDGSYKTGEPGNSIWKGDDESNEKMREADGYKCDWDAGCHEGSQDREWSILRDELHGKFR